MPRFHLISGIDIGNSAIKTVIADFESDKERPQLIGFGFSPSTALRRGVVIDQNQLVLEIKKSVEQAESLAKTKIKRAYVSISGPYIRTQLSRGVVAVSRADNEISDADLKRVIEAGSVVNLPPNREILHIIPKKFIVDGEEVENPVGMKGVRIEADVLIIDAPTPYLNSLAKAVNQNDIEVAEFVFSPLANAKAILTKEDKENGVLVFDFGGGLCDLAIFEEGNLLHMASLPIGSKHITNDLAIALKTSLENAEQIKIDHGFVSRENIPKKENIDLSNLVGEENFLASKKQIVDVINARLSEIVELVSKELKKVNKFSLLPAGINLVGGGAKLPGLVNYLKDYLFLPCRLGRVKNLEGILGPIDDPAFSVAIGLVFWGGEKEQKKGGIFGKLPSSKFINKIKDWFQQFLP